MRAQLACAQVGVGGAIQLARKNLLFLGHGSLSPLQPVFELAVERLARGVRGVRLEGVCAAERAVEPLRFQRGMRRNVELLGALRARPAGGLREQDAAQPAPTAFGGDVQGGQIAVLPARAHRPRFDRCEALERAAVEHAEQRAAGLQRVMQAFEQEAVVVLAPVVDERVGAHDPAAMLAPVAEVDLLPPDEAREQRALELLRRDGAADHSSLPVQQ